MNKVLIAGGTRPNFIKIAALWSAFKKFNRGKPAKRRVSLKWVHTGQHYHTSMDHAILRDVKLPKPNYHLRIGAGRRTVQLSKIRTRLTRVLRQERPQLLIVVGDVNSTLASAQAARALHIPVAHVEAGLRSFDKRMPEESNRIQTDAISDLLFTTCKEANVHLRREGIPPKRIHEVGNVMIDSLRHHLKAASKSKIARCLHIKSPFALVTLHRPQNVDRALKLKSIVRLLERMQSQIPLVFPIHMRTRKKLLRTGLLKKLKQLPNMRLTEPLGYLDFLFLLKRARCVLTDSGGIQEETSVLGIPCLTLRRSTERPVTLKQGTNRIVSQNPDKILVTFKKILKQKKRRGKKRIALWDGKAADRIVRVCTQFLSTRQ